MLSIARMTAGLGNKDHRSERFNLLRLEWPYFPFGPLVLLTIAAREEKKRCPGLCTSQSGIIPNVPDSIIDILLAGNVASRG